jgi:hypothetical protein
MELLSKSILKITSKLRVSLLLTMHNTKILTSNKIWINIVYSDMNESYNESSSVLIGEKSIDQLQNQDTLKSGSQHKS